MAMCVRNMTLNLYESMKKVAIPQITCEDALKSVLCLFIGYTRPLPSNIRIKTNGLMGGIYEALC
jgi:hypothetical protein